jgi:hypothetical protein
MVALAASDERRVGRLLGRAPDGDEVVLPACDDVFPVGRPADAGEAAIVGVEQIQESMGEVRSQLSGL